MNAHKAYKDVENQVITNRRFGSTVLGACMMLRHPTFTQAQKEQEINRIVKLYESLYYGMNEQTPEPITQAVDLIIKTAQNLDVQALDDKKIMTIEHLTKQLFFN